MGKTVSLAEMPWLNITNAAKLTGKSRTTIYNAVYSGELQSYPQENGYYAIEKKDLDEWMRKGAHTR
jgi:excisionase family DNA binding protein